MKEYAIIKVHFNSQVYESIPLELENNNSNTELVMNISDNGTSLLKLLKFPVDDKSFIVFSKEQLNNSVIEIKIIEGNKPIKVKKTSKVVQINS